MLREEKGQITVYLSLIFLAMLSLCMVVLEGTRSYLQSSLAEDAGKGAGEYILANYDRPLYDRYHVFFLDPRERERIASDGREYFDAYLHRTSFFAFTCRQLDITEEKTAVDDDGVYLKHQIREWMKYREMEQAGEHVKQLLLSAEQADRRASQAGRDMEKASQAIEDQAVRDAALPEKKPQGDAGEKEGQGQQEKENAKQGKQWKSYYTSLKEIWRTGLLSYVADHPQELSSFCLPDGSLPSEKRRERKENFKNFPDTFSFLDVEEWKAVLSQMAIKRWKGHAWADDYFLLNYVEESFYSYGQTSEEETALQYEVEYLIGGKKADVDNLKLTANRILGLRFLINYTWLSQDKAWIASSNATAGALTGILGFPQAQKAVQVLLTAAISFGESMLDTHALFSGEKVPVMKTADTWNLTLENAARRLRDKSPVKQGKVNAGYGDYLKLFLLPSLSSSDLLYRMMDLMQSNIALKEAGFSMEEALFSFRLKAAVEGDRWFSAFSMTGKRMWEMHLERVNSY